VKQKAYFAISGIIFGLVSILHLIRAQFEWNFDLGPYSFPVWASYLGFLVAGALSIWGIGWALKK